MPRKRVPIFPLFEEVRRTTADLTDEEFGKVIRLALSRYYGGEERAEPDRIISFAAAVLFDQAARYDSFREQHRENGLKHKSKGKQSEAKVSKNNPNTVNNTDSKQSDPPYPNPIPNPNYICIKAVQLLNDLSGSSFRANTKSTQRLIAARENEGYSLADIEMVIRHQCELWGKDEKMRKYLRPETLFGNKFEGYLSEAERCGAQQEPGYVLAPLEDPWEVAMREGNNA